jgi:predicted RNA polymerase sigma factor
MTAAKRRGIDALRRDSMLARKHAELGYEVDLRQQLDAPDLDAALDDDVGTTCCG